LWVIKKSLSSCLEDKKGFQFENKFFTFDAFIGVFTNKLDSILLVKTPTKAGK
jgi:hypothetical protein